MAAYAALVSLMNTMEQILSHPRYSTSLDKKQIESLGERVGFLLNFIESYNYCHGDSKEADDLESHIASAAHAAEDVIESHVINPIFARSSKRGSTSFLDLQKITEDLDSVKAKVMEVKKERGFKGDQEPRYPITASVSTHLTAEKNAMVGFDGYLTQLLEELTGQQSNRQIIPIVGMGGIGKTTLARNVYEHLVVVEYFHIRAWVTICQEYNVKKILLEVLSCLREPTSGMDEKTEDQLGEQLYKTLSGMRYLIILDDIWSIEVWNKIKFFFPDNYNKSRIIVTTRLSNVAKHFGSSGLAVDFLSDDESWKLFCERAFALEGCPFELEGIGKKIVRRCKGLPLAIVVIGGLLGKTSRTQEYWENVANDISSILNSGEDNQCFSILSLSYRHLPACLKPCFLYLGIFSKDHEISVSRLIKLWVAEGFIKPNKDQSLEEIAEGYIKDLVDRNLISIGRLGQNGKYKTYSIHDLLRDLCLSVAEKEKFLCVLRVLNTKESIDRQHRIIICGRTTEEEYSLDAIFQQVNLRFLAHESFPLPVRNYTYKLPSSMSLLWNVQTLIITGRQRHCEVVAPPVIWEMPQLRHLKFDLVNLPDPPSSHKKSDFVLPNLQTLQKVSNFRWSEDVCKRIPNIKKLHICYADFLGEGNIGSGYGLHNVGSLNRLESLSYGFCNLKIQDNLWSNLTFPNSLRKLYLRECKLGWEDLTIVGSLPHLEVLKLDILSVVGTEWNPIQGEFRRLKFLKIFGCIDLIHWNADRSHFPVLENLELCQLHRLDEIPSGIGEIPTLQGICLHDCSIAAAISAVKILEEQESLGNQGLQVRVKFWKKDKLEEFREKLELEDLVTPNFQLSRCSY